MDYHITSKFGQVNHLMRQVGLYNACQITLEELKWWMTQHKIDFNLGAAKEKDVIQLAALSHFDCRHVISFCVSITSHLLIVE